MGSRGSSSGKKGGSAGGGSTATAPVAPVVVTKKKDLADKVTAQDGSVVDLSKYPLEYGDKDTALSGATRAAVEAQENKRLTAKTEYGLVVDQNGNPVGTEQHGGRGSVVIPSSSTTDPRAVSVTHNHPRGKGEEGLLGGTFSGADLARFARDPFPNIRASAAEGTYSMTKTAKFDRAGFQAFAKKTERYRMGQHKKYVKQLEQDLYSGKITSKQYVQMAKDSFNQFLVNLHNDYLAYQDKYGYTYTLERRS